MARQRLERKKKQTGLRVYVDLWDRVLDSASELGMSVSDWACRAFEFYLKHMKGSRHE